MDFFGHKTSTAHAVGPKTHTHTTANMIDVYDLDLQKRNLKKNKKVDVWQTDYNQEYGPKKSMRAWWVRGGWSI